MGAMLRVETTAAAAGEVGILRYDPMVTKKCELLMTRIIRQRLCADNATLLRNSREFQYLETYCKTNDF